MMLAIPFALFLNAMLYSLIRKGLFAYRKSRFYIGQAALVLILILLQTNNISGYQIIFYTIISILLVNIAIIDYEKKLVPDFLLLMILILALFNMFLDFMQILEYLLGATFAGGTFYIVYIINKHGLGLGDVKLAGVLGLLFNYYSIVNILKLAVTMAAILIIIMIIKYKKFDYLIPFGTLIAAASLYYMISRVTFYT